MGNLWQKNFDGRAVFYALHGSSCTATMQNTHPLAAHCVGFIATASLPAAQLRILIRAWADPPWNACGADALLYADQ